MRLWPVLSQTVMTLLWQSDLAHLKLEPLGCPSLLLFTKHPQVAKCVIAQLVSPIHVPDVQSWAMHHKNVHGVMHVCMRLLVSQQPHLIYMSGTTVGNVSGCEWPDMRHFDVSCHVRFSQNA